MNKEVISTKKIKRITSSILTPLRFSSGEHSFNTFHMFRVITKQFVETMIKNLFVDLVEFSANLIRIKI